MDVRINKEVAEVAIAKFTPAAAEAYIQNLAILRNACKKQAEASNSEASQGLFEEADKLVKNAESVYPEIFAKVSSTISGVLEMYKAIDTAE